MFNLGKIPCISHQLKILELGLCLGMKINRSPYHNYSNTKMYPEAESICTLSVLTNF